MPKPLMTADEARQIFDYNPATGALRWRHTRGSQAIAGTEAGWTDANGYRQVQVDGRNYRVHRVAWLISHGEWPYPEPDHRNGTRSDNRLDNLREITRAGQLQNTALRSNNTTGFRGVYLRKNSGRWMAYISIGGRMKYLGMHDTAEAAHAAYLAAKAEAHTFQPVPRDVLP